MARIKIEDLPVLDELDAAQTKGIFGGDLKSPLKDAFVPSYDIPGSPSESVHMEEFSMNYEEVKWTYTGRDDTEQDSEKGTTEDEWRSA